MQVGGFSSQTSCQDHIPLEPRSTSPAALSSLEVAGPEGLPRGCFWNTAWRETHSQELGDCTGLIPKALWRCLSPNISSSKGYVRIHTGNRTPLFITGSNKLYCEVTLCMVLGLLIVPDVICFVHKLLSSEMQFCRKERKVFTLRPGLPPYKTASSGCGSW